MKLRLILLVVGCLFVLTGLNLKIEDTKETIAVKLQLTDQDNIAFNPLNTSIGIYSYLEKYPIYYKSLLERYQMQDNDSVVIATMFTDYKNFIYDLYKKGIVDKKTIISSNIDTLHEKKKIDSKQLSFAIDYSKNQKKIIFDENNNYNFQDDKVCYFKQEIPKANNASQSIKQVEFFKYNEPNTININRKIKIYPAALNSQSFSETTNVKVINSRLMIEFCDYWKGHLAINNKQYDFAVQGMYLSYMQILIKPASSNFSKDDYPFNKNFTYKIKDTVKLSNNYYTIDSLAKNMSNLYLTKIVDKRVNFGNKMGQQMKNYTLNDISDKAFNLNTVVAKKQVTLIDFWGTWCKPCKELTPQLIDINKKYSSNLSILSIAFDQTITSVEHYTKANKMNWSHAFIERNRNDYPYILKDLEIMEYPTFILLDRNKKIIYRNSGKKALDEIEKILSKQSLIKNTY